MRPWDREHSWEREHKARRFCLYVALALLAALGFFLEVMH